MGFSSDFERKVFGMIQKFGKIKNNNNSTNTNTYTNPNSPFEFQKLELTIA